MNQIPLKIKHKVSTLRNIVKGFRSKNRYLVIESDDWGSIRTSSQEAFQHMQFMGWPMEISPYNLDALEDEDDLRALAGALASVRDADGNPACLTANMVLANPDFDKIRGSDFREYHYTPVCEAISGDVKRRDNIEIWLRGIEDRVFQPEFHAREHVCWWRWLKDLRDGKDEARVTFDLGMCGLPLASSRENISYFTPLYVPGEELQSFGVDLKPMIVEGVNLFGKTFGTKPLSTVPPNHHWTDEAEEVWSEHGIRYIQGVVWQNSGSGRIGSRPCLIDHYTGEISRFGGIYLVRNVQFEPSINPGLDWIGSTLRQIRFSFLVNQPVIVNSHRVNYIGCINKTNRENNLALLTKLLKLVIKIWPDVRFLSTRDLGRIIDAT